MILIFEGPDRVGKTTQIKNIKKYLLDKPTFVLHYSNINGISDSQSQYYSYDLYDDSFKFIKETVWNDKRNLIFDRFHIGEFVYSQLYRNYSGEYIFDLENKYFEILGKIYLFIFIDEPQNLVSREDGNSFSVEFPNKRREIELFKTAYKKSNIKRKYLININNKTITDIENIIYELLFKTK